MAAFWERTYFHNSADTWLTAAATVLGVTGALILCKNVIVSRLKESAAKSAALWDDVLLDVAQRTSIIFQLAMGVATSTYVLDLPTHWDGRIRTAVLLVGILQAGLWGNGLVHFILVAVVDRRGPGDPAQATGRNMLRFLAMALVWGAVVVWGLDSLGFPISTLVAGLGVTGVAVALATQNIVGDLFASISILLDKPFLIGDFIVIESFAGTVERIGIKTTRLRSLGGEYLIMSNSDLTKSRVRNYRNMRERRIAFAFTVRYETPYPILQRIPAMVRESIDNVPQTRIDRVELLTFGESGLAYEVVYYVLDPSFNLYTAIQQQVNYGIIERFAAHQIEFAFRSQMNYSAEASLARRESRAS